ncbi:LysR family transcriptional regulator [Novosphingobium sp. JCM 18896]|uniref:LysR family transcriptional regulator n=1 Tax=Novosphingobium sp. JCM 18896 TaxID=2989731 RepID=UPI002222D42A|nr:LysR family transcriptional regulator [Novosphingobium sp. JCM 18896]MCW1431250.1 LysR family transcriptional regulator [Novosphingobium sp. JCM 18896]
MKVTLRQLLVFDAVATLGSVTRAATKLNMSQSAASSALTDLQIILGRSLFAHVKGRPLQITDEGKRLQPLVRSVLGEVNEIEVSSSEAPLSGRLVVGSTAMIAETVLPRLCIEFMELHPDVRIMVQAESVGDLFERLQRFELETALIEIFPDMEGIELTKWRTDELILVVAPDHPLAGRSDLRIADLAGHKWCTREQFSSNTARLRYMLHEQLGQLPVAFESTSNWAVRHAVIAGGGIGCLSRAIVQFDLDNGRLCQLDVGDFTYTRSLSLARPKAIWRGRLARAFDAFLLERGDLAETKPIG